MNLTECELNDVWPGERAGPRTGTGGVPLMGHLQQEHIIIVCISCDDHITWQAQAACSALSTVATNPHPGGLTVQVQETQLYHLTVLAALHLVLGHTKPYCALTVSEVLDR